MDSDSDIINNYIPDYTKLKGVDFAADWNIKIYLTLDNPKVISALDKAKRGIVNYQNIKEDITNWPILLLYPKDTDGDLYYFNQIMKLLNTETNTII